jgi:hypothetical protein
MNNVLDLRSTNHSKTSRLRPFVRKIRRNPWPVFLATVGVVAVIVIVALVLGASQKKAEKAAAPTEKESANTVSEVKKIMPYLLPSEEPTVATVSDISKLTGQEFFRNAQNGDMVLVFPKARIALIYRHSQHAIINFGPTVAQAAPTALPSAYPSMSPYTATYSPIPSYSPAP